MSCAATPAHLAMFTTKASQLLLAAVRKGGGRRSAPNVGGKNLGSTASRLAFA